MAWRGIGIDEQVELVDLKSLFIGKARDLSDHRLFHKISLIAVARVGGAGRGRLVVVLLRAGRGVHGAGRAHGA